MENEQKNQGNRPNQGQGKHHKRGGKHHRNRHRDRKKNENKTPEVAGAVAAPEAAEAPLEGELFFTDEELYDAPAPAPEPVDEGPKVEIVGVTFRSSKKAYYFAPGRLSLKVGTPVVVETARGIEYGIVKISNKMVPESEITPPLRIVMRVAGEQDIARYEENRAAELRALPICREKIAKHGLDMSLIAAEYVFDNSKLLFYYTSPARVDFRELAKELASIFHTRIELRQVGIRDEAKMLGGLGACGRPLCCSTFLPDFAQVSIKMAKEQNFSLNSSKVSGACNRLMCCLRFEHESYEEALKTTPAVGSYVKTPNGCGIVVEVRPLLQLVKIRPEEKPETTRMFTCEEITVLKTPKQAREMMDADRQAAAKTQDAQKGEKRPGKKGDGNRGGGQKTSAPPPESSEERAADSPAEEG